MVGKNLFPHALYVCARVQKLQDICGAIPKNRGPATELEEAFGADVWFYPCAIWPGTGRVPERVPESTGQFHGGSAGGSAGGSVAGTRTVPRGFSGGFSRGF